MATESRRQLVVLGGLALVLAAVLWWNLTGDSTPPPQPGRRTPTAGAARRAGAGGASVPGEGVEDVALDALKAARPDVAQNDRDPFRFAPKPEPAPPPPPPQAVAGAPGAAAPGGMPGAGTAAAPIPLRFIGILERPDRHQKWAVLKDDRGVYYGREGDIIEGRYRIVRIGVESIELAFVDGGSPQTIRLSGS
jgi:hypothetical protein